MRRRCATASAIALAAAVACSACSDGRTPAAPGAPSPASGAPGTTSAAPTTARRTDYPVGTREETYVDTSRPTAPNKSFAGAPDRTIRVRFYFPGERGAPARDGAPYPLVVFSHGFTARPEAYQRLLEDFARAGYVVAAPAYPLSNRDAPGGPVVTDLANQPKDASFVIDRVLEAARGDGWLGGLVDAARIGAGGHSLGAFTTFGLAWNTTCNDARVKAAMAMSGGRGGCAGAYFGDDRTPLLAVHGDRDEVVPYGVGRSTYAAAPRPKFFLTIRGGRHSSDELGGTTPGQRAVTRSAIAFFDFYLRGEAGALERLRRVATVDGLTTFDAQP
jgi:dienelactone hydrolase